MEDADSASEQAEDTDDGKARENGENEGLSRLARDQRKGHRREGEREREQHYEPDAAVALGAVSGWLGVAHRRIDVGHGPSKYPIRINLTGHCHECVAKPMRPQSFLLRERSWGRGALSLRDALGVANRLLIWSA